MPDDRTTAERASTTGRGAGATAGEGAGADTSLQTERGRTTIADAVVTKVAGVAAREVRGVYDLGGGMARTLGSVTQRVGVGDERTQGVSVEVGEREAAVDLTVVVEYGESIPRVSQAVRDNVIKRIEGITGLSVTEVNVSVDDLYFPGDEAPEQPARVQ
ncbi:MAG: Asp23/Gls24 family envelope stress response protein [Solirubrobacterales bacterium]|nr:Asp23/Gls24 family envelope stress response protein [Solirubrobacterales bacterium]